MTESDSVEDVASSVDRGPEGVDWTEVARSEAAPPGGRAGREHAPASSTRRDLLWFFGATAGVSMAALAIFWNIFTRDVSTDLSLHTDMTQRALASGNWPGNPLFYVLNALGTAFSDDLRALRASAVVILTIAVASKFVLSWKFLRAEAGRVGFVAPGAAVAVLAGFLVFAFSLPTTTPYLGQVTPNVWHNSTTILLVPFALWMFMAGLRYARDGGIAPLLSVGIAGAFGVATKPTFTMAFGVALPIFVLIVRGRARPALASLCVSLGLALLVAGQYAYIYFSDASESAADSGVAFRPFHVWSFYSDNIGLSVLASFALPIVAIAVLRGRLLSNSAFRLAALLTAVSIGMFMLLGETGPREYDGNFIWQAYVSMYLLFMAVAATTYAAWRSGLPRLSTALLLIAGGAHCASGAWFLYYMFSRGQIV